MSQVNGVVAGIVKSLDDPDNLGRVEVYFPWLSEDNRTFWARIATFMAGPERGSWFMPEIDDEVLVAFEQGDMQHPYVVGFLWNGQDRPPNSDIDTKVRRLRTVSGHVVDFDDRAGQEKIVIKSQGNHQVEMKDTPPAAIKITTADGQTVEMNDGPPASVTVKTAAGQEIKLDDALQAVTVRTSTGQEISATPTGITISAQTGMVAVNCLQATIQATAMLNVTAPIAQFAGVVQASAIVGAAYTPAPGNTFGL
jgi:uncharacterized protein involved in type VI secretion and phage assembly